MKLYTLSKTGTEAYRRVVDVFIDSTVIEYALDLDEHFAKYPLDEFDLIKLDGETIYVSEEKLQEQEETLERIIDEHGSIGGFFEHCIKMINGGRHE